MADDVPAARRTRGHTAAAAARTTPVFLIAAAATFIGVSAHQSATLAYFAALLVSAVPVMRAAWPDHVDRDLHRLDAALRRVAPLARAGLATAATRADVEARARRLRDAARDHATLAPVCDRIEEIARFARAGIVDGVGVTKTWAEAMWREHRDAARAAGFVLRLVGVVAYTAATALVNLVYEEAGARAPAVLSHFRGVIKEIRCNQGTVPSSSSGFIIKYSDFACLVKWVVFFGIYADIALHANPTGSSLPIILLYAVTLTSTGVMLQAWVSRRHDSSDAATRGTATAAGTRCTVGRRAGGSPTARAAERKALTELSSFLWSLMVTSYFVDAYLLRATLGQRTLRVVFLALCHVKIINVGKEVQRAQEDGDGGAGRWRRTAVAVLAACVTKATVVGVVLSVQMAALSLVSLCVMTVVLLIREESLLRDLDASGGDVNSGEEGAGGLAGNVAGGGADEVKSERSNTGAEDGEDGSALELEEHGDSSEENVEEQRDEEPDCSSSSSSMDSWEFVEVLEQWSRAMAQHRPPGGSRGEGVRLQVRGQVRATPHPAGGHDEDGRRRRRRLRQAREGRERRPPQRLHEERFPFRLLGGEGAAAGVSRVRGGRCRSGRAV